MTATFHCGACRQLCAVKGSTIERYLGVRTRICPRCGSKRTRAMAAASRKLTWAKNLKGRAAA